MLKLVSRIIFVGALVFTVAACEDSLLQKNPTTVDGKTSGDGRDPVPGDKKQNPGESYPFPEIIETEFIPREAPFNDWKCLAWKITWPWYDGDYDSELIPTVFSVNNSELNSISFLNNTAASNTHNSTMSLYYNYKLESASVMWSELDHSFGNNGMEGVYFVKTDMEEDHVMDWVQNRPVLWKNYWPGSPYSDLEYEEGDFIQFKLVNADLYGVIRIVSMTPRIIEVYLAVPNN